MKMPCLLLVLALGFLASGCRTLSYVSLEDLSEDEVAELDSPAGLAVAGYLSNEGTTFPDLAIARRGYGGGIKFTPMKPTRLFPDEVVVRRDRIHGLGLPRTSIGKTVVGVVLVPLLILPALMTGAEGLNNYMNMVTLGGLK